MAFKRPIRRCVPLLAALLLAVAAAPARAQAPVELRVMTFNVWLGGDVVDFGRTVQAIRDAQADVVGLQEAEGNTRRIAEALGWAYWSDRLHVVSRLPLIDPPPARGEYVLVQTTPGRAFTLANVHLTSDPYGPYAVRDGRSRAAVLRLERTTRMPEIRAALAAVAPLRRRRIPALMTGDFNTPSHLDWTRAVTAVRPEVRYPVAWPVTRALAAAGFRDTYRVAHPDPVAAPGITWTFGYPFPRLDTNEVVDRIDLVQATRDVEVLDSGIVGPAATPDVTVPVDPYPSDHRAVVSTVRLTPVAPPPFASVLHRRVERGETVGVRYGARGENRLAVVRAGGGADGALMTLPPQEARFYGAVTFGTGGLRPGRYEALLLRGNRVRSRAPFWVVRPGARPSVHVARRVRAGRPVRVAWRDAPAFRRDWIGVWRAGEPDLYNGYLSFAYTGATVADVGSLPGLPPGRYVVRLMRDDGYAELARDAFTVVARGARRRPGA